MKRLKFKIYGFIMIAGLLAGLVVDGVYVSLRKSSFFETDTQSTQLSLNTLSENIGLFVKVGDVFSLHKSASLFISFVPDSNILVSDLQGNELLNLSNGEVSQASNAFSSSIVYSGENLGTLSLKKRPLIFSLNANDYFFCFSMVILFLVIAFFVAKILYSRFKIETKGLERIDALRKQVAHDIKSPLSALNLATQSLPADLKDHKDLLLGASERIQNIAEDLKAQVNSEQKKSSKAIEVKGVLQKLIKEKQVEFSNIKDLSFAFENDLVGSEAISIEKETFHRVLSNIINNAAESYDPDKSDKKILVTSTKNEGALSITVSDNGSGIQKQHQKKIFRSGFTKGKAKGSGLGLYHAKKSIEEFGGNLILRSEFGKGTTVSIFLPLQK